MSASALSLRSGRAGKLGMAALLAAACAFPAAAQELVQRNPFDPQHQPWKKTGPALPAITAQDLQIEGIIVFGSYQVIIAQLDGKLKNSLPANAAGKVRIAVGQTFGGGYVLESLDAGQAIVSVGSARYAIPLVRRNAQATLASAAPPAPAAPPPFQPSTPAPVAPPPPAATSAAQPVAAPANNPFAAAASAAAASPTPEPPAAAPLAANTPSSTPQQGMSLLDAIRAAQANARNNPSNPTPPPAFLAPKN